MFYYIYYSLYTMVGAGVTLESAQQTLSALRQLAGKILSLILNAIET